MICFGVFVAFIIGNFSIPYVGTEAEAISEGWRIVFGFPLIICVF